MCEGMAHRAEKSLYLAGNLIPFTQSRKKDMKEAWKQKGERETNFKGSFRQKGEDHWRGRGRFWHSVYPYSKSSEECQPKSSQRETQHEDTTKIAKAGEP